jgi:ABC-type glycerol-3-phosphate transport system substrate-binding protein
VAARRLLIVLVLLLAASIAAAALAPDRRSTGVPPGQSSSTTTTTTTTSTPEPTGAAISARIDASTKDPETVDAAVGDQLALSVGVGDGPGRTVTIADLGLTEFAAPEGPAHFNLLLREAGAIAITDEQGDVIGRIEVTAAGGSRKGSAGASGDGEDT